MYHLCSAHHVPDIMRGSFIEKGYRLNYSWQMCLKSVFRAHNETLNVWTHFIGFLIFLGTDKLYYESISHPHPLQTLSSHINSSANFTTFPAFSSHHHYPSSFFNFTNSFPFLNTANFSNKFPQYPFSFDFDLATKFPSFYYHPSTYTTPCELNMTYIVPCNPNMTTSSMHHYFHSHFYHPTMTMENVHITMEHVQQAMKHKAEEIKNKAEELKHFIGQCRDHLNRKMNSFHDTLENYLKDIEKSVHEFSDHTNVSIASLSERMSQLQVRFDEQLSKFFSPKSKLPIMVFLFSGMVCFMFSTLYHTFGCQSVGHCAFYLKVDYSGISTLIAGSLVPFVWYVFHGLTHWQFFYVGTLFVLAALVLYVSFSDQFSTPEYQPYRALCFVLMAAFSIIPFVHMLFLYGTVEIYSFQRCALSAFLYLLGVAAYVSRVPERLFPGKCDFMLQSHQVFHTFIVAAALVWYTFALRLLDSNTYIN